MISEQNSEWKPLEVPGVDQDSIQCITAAGTSDSKKTKLRSNYYLFIRDQAHPEDTQALPTQ